MSRSNDVNKKTKRQMQDKWKKMYMSVGKLNGQNDDKANSRSNKIEKKLREIKKLRYQDKISADEYKRRKQNLLDQL